MRHSHPVIAFSWTTPTTFTKRDPVNNCPVQILDHIDTHLSGNSPVAFGLHPNAEIEFRTVSRSVVADSSAWHVVFLVAESLKESVKRLSSHSLDAWSASLAPYSDPLHGCRMPSKEMIE